MAVPEISAIVVNYRRPDILGACLGSLDAALARTGEPDRGRGGGQRLRRRVLRPRRGGWRRTRKLLEMPDNLGFPTAVSKGIQASTGDWVLLINNDVEVEPDAVRAHARRRPLAAADRLGGGADALRQRARHDQLGRDRRGPARASPSTACSASRSPPARTSHGGLRSLRRRRALPARDARGDRRLRRVLLLRAGRRRRGLAGRR